MDLKSKLNISKLNNNDQNINSIKLNQGADKTNSLSNVLNTFTSQCSNISSSSITNSTSSSSPSNVSIPSNNSVHSENVDPQSLTLASVKLEYCASNEKQNTSNSSSDCTINSINYLMSNINNNNGELNLPFNNSSLTSSNENVKLITLAPESNNNIPITNITSLTNNTNYGNHFHPNHFYHSTFFTHPQLDFNTSNLNNLSLNKLNNLNNNSNNNFQDEDSLPVSNGLERCATCSNQIIDRFIMKLNNHSYHEKCLLCCSCGFPLFNVCYQKNSKLYCKMDYLRIFSQKCDACNEAILPNELVMKIHSNTIFHLKCFSCNTCKLPLKTGEQFSFNGSLLLCKTHLKSSKTITSNSIKIELPSNFLNLNESNNSSLVSCNNFQVANHQNQLLSISNNANHLISSNISNLVNTSLQQSPLLKQQANLTSKTNSTPITVTTKHSTNKQDDKPFVRNRNDGRRGPKRPRTILTTAQRRAFKNSFEMSQKPCRKVREGLAKETGLSVRIVQVWFQNQRAKLKKIQRKQMQHQNHHSHSMSNKFSHLQSNASFLNEESQLTDSSEEFEQFQFVNSPGGSSYYSPNNYSKSVNFNEEEEDSENDDDLLQDEDKKCSNNLNEKMTTKLNKSQSNLCNNKANLISNNANSGNNNSTTSNSNDFDFLSNNSTSFPSKGKAINFMNSISSNSIDLPKLTDNTLNLGVAVAQTITSSNEILNSCTKLNQLNPNTQALNTNLTSNSVEYTIQMTPIDKLYSMQSSYFNSVSEYENFLASNRNQ